MPARSMSVALALAALLAISAAPAAFAQSTAAGCPQEVTFDPAVPTFDEVVGVPLGAGGTGSTPRRLSEEIHRYFDRLVSHTVEHGRVKVLRKDFGTSVLGKQLRFYVVSSRDNIDNLDAGRRDGPFWEGVKDGTVPAAQGIAEAGTRPALGWITATPHGNEPAAGEAISRMLYELVARTDCWNLKRLKDMDLFLMPVRNPDGRDAPGEGQRTSAWAFDHNRDFGTQTQVENATFLPLLKRYPGLFFIDAHQQSTGYFFPPNEDPVLHEISNFSLDFIQNRIGPALQQKFNDQSAAYQNYNTYDLFVPEYGDSVPTLLSGAAGMTFEKGRSEVYGKQVYDHYLAIDETVNVTVRDKANILRGWTAQWQEAIDQGQQCALQPNKIVSPLRGPVAQQVPLDARVCGYFYRPDNHAGDAAALIRHMQRQGVHVYRFETDAALNGVREFGEAGFAGATRTLPRGTLYIPMNQPLKHWIQAVLGEDPFNPLPQRDLFYDVAQWSYSLQRGQSGNGFLTQQPTNVQLTEIADPAFGSAPDPATTHAVYAFDTDSMRGLALAADLLEAGRTVYRAPVPFTAAGKQFRSGAALVDGASLTEGQRTALRTAAVRRQTPVSGLAAYPAVARYAMDRPKIGLYTGSATEPNNPVRPAYNTPYPGHCGVGGNTTYCQALFTLTQKIGLPASTVLPITTTDLAAGRLVSEQFTALINPSSTVAAGPGATALQAFVNQGGRYVGQLTGGTASARNAGLTTLNTRTIPDLFTPGAFFTGTFDTSNPVAWGFDNGGFLYRERVSVATQTPVFDPATLAGSGSIPAAVAPVRYSDPLRSFGYTLNALGAGQLPGTPAVVDQPFGAGRSILVGFDAFYRAWRDSDERLILNAVLYPDAAAIPAPAGTGASAQVAPAAEAQAGPGQSAAGRPAAPLAKAKLTAVRRRPLKVVDRTAADVRIRVARRDGAKLRGAVKAARLPRAIRRRAGWVTTRKSLTFVVRDARKRYDEHDRRAWTGKILFPLKKGGIRILLGQL